MTDPKRTPATEPGSIGEACPNCGWVGPLIWVHGHGQCPRCGTVIVPCCEGSPIGEAVPGPVPAAQGDAPD